MQRPEGRSYHGAFLIPAEHMRLLCCLLLLASLLAPVASAQTYGPHGFSLGFGVQRAGISFDEDAIEGDDAESGFGGGLTAEYGFNDTFSLFLNVDGADVDGATLTHVDLGGRAYLWATEDLFPYVQVGLTGFGLSEENDTNEAALRGGALSAGLGLRYFFSPKLAFDVNGVYATGEFTEVEINDVAFDDLDVDAHTTRFRFGVVFFLTR